MDSVDESCLPTIRRKRLEYLHNKRQGIWPVPAILINRICPLPLWPNNAPDAVAWDSERIEVHEIRKQPSLEVQKLGICLFDWLLLAAHGLLCRVHQLDSPVWEWHCDGYHHGLLGLGHHQWLRWILCGRAWSWRKLLAHQGWCWWETRPGLQDISYDFLRCKGESQWQHNRERSSIGFRRRRGGRASSGPTK